MNNIFNIKGSARFFWLYPRITSSIIAIHIFLFIVLFKPYGLHVYEYKDILTLGGIFAMTGSLIAYASYKIVERYLSKNWTFIKDILWAALTLFVIASVNYLVTYTMTNFTTYWSTKPETLEFWESLSYTFSIGGLIYIFLITTDDFLKRLFEVKPSATNENFVVDTVGQSDLLDEDYSSISELSLVVLVGKNKDDLLELNPNNIIFIESKGNYVRIVYLNDDRDKQIERIFRSSIKELCHQLNDYDFLYCCHRSFITNLKLIDEVKGNAKSKKVEYNLVGVQYEVPVSRLKIPEFESAYSNISLSTP